MELLIGLAMSAALLYFWLIGHWFARILVFLGLAFVACFGGLLVGTENQNPVAGVVVGFIGLLAAWLVASIPMIYWRLQWLNRITPASAC